VTRCSTELLIFGGGIAGLWLLNRLRRAGYEALLVESDALGSGQTRYSQGIIHGGTKYALTGKLTASSEAIAAMPARWRDCLAGRGELDLSTVQLLSEHQYLWSTASLGSRLAGFFASHAMRSRTAPIPAAEYPAALRQPGFRGQVYRLDEPVLEVGSLLRALMAPVADRLLWAEEAAQFTPLPAGEGWEVELAAADRRLTITARRLVLVAGRGNAALLARLGQTQPAMQLRPLNMVLLRGAPAPLYAHCLGASTTPRLTVTSHPDPAGGLVWYLGGQLAEAVDRGEQAQLAAARAELAALFPWFDLAAAPLALAPIDRAEPRRTDGSRPDDAFLHAAAGVFTLWPTKLAFAPRLADRLIEQLEPPQPSRGEDPPVDWPRSQPAPLPWEEPRWR